MVKHKDKDNGDIKHCPRCGDAYVVFCMRCRKKHRLERTEAEMEKCGLTEETLIQFLSQHIKDGNFPALSKAIDMMDMRPTNKTEVSGPDGEPLIDAAKERLLSKIASIAKRSGSD
jgi:predicted RNA-binding Zn-ribbon protein involved in translation (DUF1610 family)